MISKKTPNHWIVLMATALVMAVWQPAMAAAASGEVRMVPLNVSDLAEKARPGVVNIQVEKNVSGSGFQLGPFSRGPRGQDGEPVNPFEEFFDQFQKAHPGRSFKQRGVGSGFVIDTQGYIVTNNHVIDEADQVKVRFADGREAVAEVVGTDPQTDLALIRIKESAGLTPLSLGNSDEIKVGAWVVAIGSPFGLEQTVTTGIVSAKGRVIGAGPYDHFIQTDASINPGNSGGPLIDMNGEVIGINTAIIASGQGIGFAIPINLARDIIRQLKESGHVTRGWLGVGIQDLTAELKDYYKIDLDSGVLVTQVFQGEPAETAGIKEGDVIVAVNGESVGSSYDLSTRVAGLPVGADAKVTLIRDGRKETVTVKLGKRGDDVETASAPASKNDARLGLGLAPLDNETRQYFGYSDDQPGVLVTEVTPNSPADKAGFQRGDLILEVNRKAVSAVKDVTQSLNKSSDANRFLVKRGSGGLWVAVIK